MSHLEVSYVAPEDSASNFAQDTSDAGQSKRRNGGKLAVNLLVKGHYTRNLNVDFDYIVQDSINRQTHAIRRQLTMFNQNCRDQTTKIVDQGFSLEDFLVVHTSRGVKKTLDRGRAEQQAGIVQDEEVQAFSSACDQDALVSYFWSYDMCRNEPSCLRYCSNKHPLPIDSCLIISKLLLVGLSFRPRPRQ